MSIEKRTVLFVSHSAELYGSERSLLTLVTGLQQRGALRPVVLLPREGPLQAAACTYRLALGPRAGQKVLSLQTLPSQSASPTQQCCVKEQGFSLHAEVWLGRPSAHKLEHLCRYITRPALANERLKRNRAGDVVLQLKTAYQDGTMHMVMSSLEFMQRLAAARAGSPKLFRKRSQVFSYRLTTRQLPQKRSVVLLPIQSFPDGWVSREKYMQPQKHSGA